MSTRTPRASRTAAPTLEFDGVVRDFPDPSGKAALRVIDTVDFAVEPGRFTAIIGPSGCGKSTLLQMAAGLIAPTAGTVRQNGCAVSGINRNVGFVPQQAQLLPWKTLRENIELPLLLRHVAPKEREKRARDIIAAVGLAGFEHHDPRQLSGGMQKCVSIARTLIYGPELILIDETFGALDAGEVQRQFFAKEAPQALLPAVEAMKDGITHKGELGSAQIDALLRFTAETDPDVVAKLRPRAADGDFWTNAVVAAAKNAK
jgi:ABC-type nitrate/sulfonate/bicarbonate transport system ATPase subunit